MVLFKHEMKSGRNGLLIWLAAIASMLALCIFIYPEMASSMGEVSEMFANMGGFSQAFGMDQINFGEFVGFFAVECGNVLGLGGALFAALIGISALAKEEKEKTAEFLLTHPISRVHIVSEKLAAVLVQIVLLNIGVIVVTLLSILAVGEEVPAETLTLLFVAYFIMQLEVAAITFGISAFIRRGSLGIGLGLAAMFFFMNIVSNLTEDAKFLKYITPMGYTDGPTIVAEKALNGNYLAVGMAFLVLGIVAAYWKYCKKDIA